MTKQQAGAKRREGCLSVAEVPHVSRLFRDHQQNFERVRRWYSPPPVSGESSREFPKECRAQVAEVLRRENSKWGAGAVTLANIARLRDGASAVVTGQQAVLFGGPLFTLLKAVTAIQEARELGAVPIFWLATEDHDLAEVSRISLLSAQMRLHQARIEPKPPAANSPVADVRFGEELEAALKQVDEALGTEAAELLRHAYETGGSFGDGFARLFLKLFEKYGLILLDPNDAELHRISRPVFEEAIEKAEAIGARLLALGKELDSAGYEAQVKVTASSTLLFLLEGGSRLAVHRNGSTQQFSAGEKKYSRDELLRIAREEPQRLSANVLLRPAMQDFLLPTLAYVGGPAEVTYFAQAQVVYEELLGNATPVLARASATLIEPKAAKRLAKYGLSPAECLVEAQGLRQLIASRAVPGELAAEFEKAQFELGETLEGLRRPLESLDPTLLEASQRSFAKISYQLSRLQKRAGEAALRKDADASRHADEISHALFPHGNLQEREVAGISFLSRHGLGLIDKLMESVSRRCPGHQFIRL